jgi:membrane-bound ClpP family serine protease
MPLPILLLEILLVALGIIFLVLEFKAPGHIASGVIALVCFAAFFLIHIFTGGHLIFLGVSLFVIGIACLAIEVFLVPGHGVAGVCGILLVLFGLVFAGLESWPETPGEFADMLKLMLRHVLTMACAVLVAIQLAKYLPDMPYVSRLVLIPPADKPDEDDSVLPGADAAAELLGHVGTSISELRPSGTARFGDRRVDVLTEWGFIEPGTPVQVVEVEGTRIVVKKVGPR